MLDLYLKLDKSEKDMLCREVECKIDNMSDLQKAVQDGLDYFASERPLDILTQYRWNVVEGHIVYEYNFIKIL